MNHIKRIAHGDMEALGILYEAYKTPVYRLAFSMTGSRVLAEDITQDTFLRIQEKADTYRHNTSEAAWIFTIARNLTYDALRRQRRESPEDTDSLLQLPSAEGNPEGGTYAFLDLISNLPAKDAEIVNLRILGDLSFKEIGRITKLSADACGKRYTRALNKLRREI